MSNQDLAWYVRRLGRMSSREVAWRFVAAARGRQWRRHQVRPGTAWPAGSRRRLPFAAPLPAPASTLVPGSEAAKVLAAADDLIDGRWEVLGVHRSDVAAPDWFLDPLTGRRAPQRDYCFSINHRSEAVTGNVKQVWELSRLQHVTVLAAAYALSGRERYAVAADSALRSWWAENPFLSGVHWTSGIELGLRLISWVWTRRLLDDWPGAADLFENNPQALSQIRWHQKYLAAYRSRGSSANNHVIAEASGQLVAALAFPWFPESRRWAERSARLLEDEVRRNTFPSGVNREMAFEYHAFVAELVAAAVVEADRAGRPLEQAKIILCRMLDVIAATLDEQMRPPRHGDGDDGRGFLFGPPGTNRWASLLAFGRSVYGSPDWWPAAPTDPASAFLAALAVPTTVADRPATRPDRFDDAGLTILRTGDDDRPEIWCRCDGGPHGFLSIAAHAHADALSVEVRHGGVDVLADPGTYCYHGEDAWRRYFRSTIAHNTLEIGGTDQSTSGGHFLWVRHADARPLAAPSADPADERTWSAEHDGYQTLDPPARHRRTVRLRGHQRSLVIDDEVTVSGQQDLRLAFHLGPAVAATLAGDTVELQWAGRRGAPVGGRLRLPDRLSWSLWRGSPDPILGWYSPGFGIKEPTTTLIGEGSCCDVARYRTVLEFDD